MRSLCLSLFVIVTCLNLMGQNDLKKNINLKKVPHHYYDEEENRITKQQFSSRKNDPNVYQYSIPYKAKLDKLVISAWVYRQYFYKLEPQELKRIQDELRASIDYPFDFSKDLAVGYFHAMSNQRLTDFYLNTPRFNSYEDAPQYIALVNPDDKVKEVKFPYYYDTVKIMQSVFFPLRIAESNWMVLKPDGTYRVYYGEGGPGMFMDEMGEKWDNKFIKSQLNRKIDWGN